MRFIFLVFAFVALADPVVCAEVKIDAPANDRLTMSSAINVAGSASPDGESVEVSVGGAPPLTASVAGGRWSIDNLNLVVGVNSIEARIQDKSDTVMVIRGGDNVEKRPPQKVFFLWNDGVDQELKKLAQGSLDAQLSESQLDTFVSRAKARAVEVFSAAYKSTDVQVVPAAGPDVHTISMMSIEDTLFGQSPPDCGNKKLKEISEVHVGTYRREMVKRFKDWGPMLKSDALPVRIEDVGQALGRTSAHEIGHSLGLVGGAGDTKCVWMDGCDDGHNCDSFDDTNALANRFDDGWHIMDPGGKTMHNARLAEPDADQRAAQRVPSNFEAFGASYLSVLHPLPLGE